jgi:hypothetical protein
LDRAGLNSQRAAGVLVHGFRHTFVAELANRECQRVRADEASRARVDADRAKDLNSFTAVSWSLATTWHLLNVKDRRSLGAAGLVSRESVPAPDAEPLYRRKALSYTNIGGCGWYRTADRWVFPLSLSVAAGAFWRNTPIVSRVDLVCWMIESRDRPKTETGNSGGGGASTDQVAVVCRPRLGFGLLSPGRPQVE